MGPEHPKTLLCLINLGGTLLEQRKFAEAADVFRQAIELTEKVLGPEHSQTLTCINNLAGVFFESGSPESAVPLLMHVHEISLKTQGGNHLQTISAADKLALALARTGEFAGARSYYKRAAEGFERILGPGHEKTQSAKANRQACQSALNRRRH